MKGVPADVAEQPAEILIRGLIAGNGPHAMRSPESIAAGFQFTFAVRL